jgi:PAS domain S-box-containing protein
MNIIIPQKTIQKWQEIVDLIAEIMQVPVARIMKVEDSEIAAFIVSQSKNNPYKRGEKVSLNSGFYCETVIETRKMLIVQDALEDKKWDSNSDIELGMISYLGFPITWPDGKIFGTICVLDNEKNAYSDPNKRLLLQFRDVIEADLKILIENDKNSGSPENILSHAIYAMDAKGFFTYLSPGLEQITGYSPDQMVGEHFSQLIHPDDLYIATSGFEKAVSGISDIFELRVVGKDEKISLMRITTQHIQDDGHYIGVIGLANDITEQERVAAALQGNGEEFRTLLERAEPIIIVVAKDGQFQFINRSGARLLGGIPEDFQGKTMADLFPKKMAEGQMADIRKALVTGKTRKSIRQSLVGNEMRWFEAHIQPLKGFSEDYDRCLVVIMDITEAKQAEEALRKSEEKYKTLFNSAADAIFIHDLKGRFLEVNDVACQRLGYTREELLKMKPMDIDSPDHASKVKGRIDDVIRDGYKIFESAQISRDGKVIPIELHARLIDYESKKAILAVARDITERKLAEKTLNTEHYQRKELEAIINRSPIIVFLWKAEKGWPIELVSDNIAHFGYLTEDFVSGRIPFADIIHPDDLARIKEEVETYTQEGLSEFEQEYRVLTKTGEVRWVDDRTTVRRDPTGRVTHYHGILLDITERRRFEDNFRETKELLQKTFESLDTALFILDTGGKPPIIVETNKEASNIFGYEKDEMIGQTTEFLHENNETLAEFQKTLSSKIETAGYLSFFESTMKRKSGDIFPSEHSVIPLRGKNGDITGWVSVVRDITERKQAEKELQKYHEELEKRVKERTVELEAKNIEMERFAYTVSHDLRAPLFTIQGFVGFLKKDIEGRVQENIDTDLEMIEEAVCTMDKLMRDTLELSRIGRVINPSVEVSFGDLVQNALSQLSEKVRLSNALISVDKNWPKVCVDQTRITEALVNLIENSIKYMGDQEHPQIDLGYRKDKSEPVFFVRDNGMGIDPSQHDKIFEIFYQIDNSNEGTGAGLSIVKRIINVHGGTIWIESKAGQGCTVCFILPIHS